MTIKDLVLCHQTLCGLCLRTRLYHLFFLQLDEVNRESASELREQLRIQKEAHTVHMAESMEMQVRGRGG